MTTTIDSTRTLSSIKFPFDERKAKSAASVLLQQEGGRMPYIRLIKLLYLADRESIDRRGRPIVGGRYVSMKYGPVLSEVLDLVRTGGLEWSEAVEKENHDVLLRAVQTWVRCPRRRSGSCKRPSRSTGLSTDGSSATSPTVSPSGRTPRAARSTSRPRTSSARSARATRPSRRLGRRRRSERTSTNSSGTDATCCTSALGFSRPRILVLAYLGTSGSFSRTPRVATALLFLTSQRRGVPLARYAKSPQASTSTFP